MISSFPPFISSQLTFSSYDRLSPPFKAFLETLTATCAQPVFKSASDAGSYELMSPRGSPMNFGDKFAPVHPVVRTHPVTGWKSLFAGVGLHVSRINDVYSYEDQMIRDYVMRLIARNHDSIARMHWTKQACAIWSNACTLHAATVRLSVPPEPGVSHDLLGHITVACPFPLQPRQATVFLLAFGVSPNPKLC